MHLVGTANLGKLGTASSDLTLPSDTYGQPDYCDWIGFSPWKCKNWNCFDPANWPLECQSSAKPAAVFVPAAPGSRIEMESEDWTIDDFWRMQEEAARKQQSDRDALLRVGGGTVPNSAFCPEGYHWDGAKCEVNKGPFDFNLPNWLLPVGLGVGALILYSAVRK